MNNTKHTPGEWAHTDGSIYSYGVGHGADIATVNTDSAHFTEDEAEANARLIAAAPELLEALQKISQMSDSGSHEQAMLQMKSIAQLAINKAIGD